MDLLTGTGFQVMSTKRITDDDVDLNVDGDDSEQYGQAQYPNVTGHVLNDFGHMTIKFCTLGSCAPLIVEILHVKIFCFNWI